MTDKNTKNNSENTKTTIKAVSNGAGPIREKQNMAFEKMKGQFHYKNSMQAPKLVKAVISVGVGSFKDKNKIKVVQDRLAKITGQKAVERGAKQSIATFKTRQGDVIGLQVTIRGARMNDFIEKLIHIALPRTKDFRGISKTSVDDMGNLTMGIKEHTIFPETADEELKDVFGLAITLVSTAKNKAEAQEFFSILGIPFK